MDDIKKLIRSILISSPLEMEIFKLNKDYEEINGENIPYKSFGFASLEDLLRSIPDIVEVHGSGPRAVLKVIVSEKCAHIDKLIAKQRVTQPRKRIRNRPAAQRRSTAARQAVPFHHQQLPYYGGYPSYPIPYHITPQFNPPVVRSYALPTLRQNLPPQHFQTPRRDMGPRFNPLLQQGLLPLPAGYSSHHYNTPPRLNHVSTPYKPSPSATPPPNHVSTPYKPSPSTTPPLVKSPQLSPLVKTPNLSSTKNQPAALAVTTPFETSCSNTTNKIGSKSPLTHQKSPLVNEPSSNGAIPKQKTDFTPRSSPNLSPEVDCYYSDQDCYLSDGDYTEDCLNFPPEDEYINYNVPFAVQDNLKKLISQCKEGIWCAEMPNLYQKMFKKPLDYSEYGYRSLIQMCMGLEKVFYCHRPDNGDFFLFDKTKPIPRDLLMSLQYASLNKAKLECKSRINEAPTEPAVVDVEHLMKDINLNNYPPGVIQLGEEISRQFLPDCAKENQFVDVVVGEVYDPSKFWILLKEHSNKLDLLMDELQTFYTSFEGNLEIPENMLKIGLYCAAKYNNEYHRAIIVNKAVDKSKVKVFYADYGTLSTINWKGLLFLHKKFSNLPLQAIRARLASIWPPTAFSTWPIEASSRFLSLVRSKDLVAQLFRIIRDKQILEIFLVDTSTPEDIYMNDTLVHEGLALFTNQEQAKKVLHPRRIPKYKHMHLFPTFEDLEWGHAPNATEVVRLYKIGVPEEYLFPSYYIEVVTEDMKSNDEQFVTSQKKLVDEQKRLRGESTNPDWAELCKEEEGELPSHDKASPDSSSNWAELYKEEEKENTNDKIMSELSNSSQSEQSSPSPEAAFSPSSQIFATPTIKPPPGFESVKPGLCFNPSIGNTQSGNTADNLALLARRANALSQAQPLVLPPPILVATQPVNYVTQQVIDPTLFVQNDLLRQFALANMLGYEQQTHNPNNPWHQDQYQQMLINQQKLLLIAQQQKSLLFQQQNPGLFQQQQTPWSNPNQMFQQANSFGNQPASDSLGVEQRQQLQGFVHKHLMNGNRDLLVYLGNILSFQNHKKEGLLFKILHEVQSNESTAFSLRDQGVIITNLLDLLADSQIIDLANSLLTSTERQDKNFTMPNACPNNYVSEMLEKLISQVSISSKAPSDSSQNSSQLKNNTDAEVQTDVELENNLKANTRRLVIETVLQNRPVHVIHFKNNLYVPVNDIFQFTTSKPPIDLIRKLVVMMDPMSSVVDIQLREHKELAKELSRFKICDATVHAVSIKTVPSVTKYLGSKEDLFNSYNDFLNSVNVNSDLWLKS